MTDTIDTDRATQMAFARGLIETTVGRIEALLRQTDATDGGDFAIPLAVSLLAEILHDRHGPEGLGMLIDAATFSARQVAAGKRLTEPKEAGS